MTRWQQAPSDLFRLLLAATPSDRLPSPTSFTQQKVEFPLLAPDIAIRLNKRAGAVEKFSASMWRRKGRSSYRCLTPLP